MSAIHQITAGYARGDAISNEARMLRAMFREWGHPSDIFSEVKRIPKDLREDALDIGDLAAALAPTDIVILHLSIGSPVNAVFRELRCRKVILYHNITPPDFFLGIQGEIRAHLQRGLDQIKALAGAADLNLAVSRFNAEELALRGYRDVKVMPMMLDRGQWDGPVDRRITAKYGDGRTNILFVGRGAPNKRIEDLLATLHYVQKAVDPDARLIHVGSFGGLERYHALLQTKVYELRLNRVEFLGSIKADALRACYQIATVFLSVSEHEGFGIPLIEAMAKNVPVVAFAAAAVPETMGGAGVLVREKRFDVIAETIGELARNARLRDAVIAGQRQRVDAYLGQDFQGRWRELLATLL